jgi:hypothetical protein
MIDEDVGGELALAERVGIREVPFGEDFAQPR